MTTINKIWGHQQKNLIHRWTTKMGNLAYNLDDYQPRSQAGFLKRARKTINGEYMDDVIWAYGIQWMDQGKCIPNEIHQAFSAYSRLNHPDSESHYKTSLSSKIQDLGLLEKISNKYRFALVSIGWAGTPPKDDNYRADIEIIEDELSLIELIELFFKLNEELKTTLKTA